MVTLHLAGGVFGKGVPAGKALVDLVGMLQTLTAKRKSLEDQLLRVPGAVAASGRCLCAGSGFFMCSCPLRNMRGSCGRC